MSNRPQVEALNVVLVGKFDPGQFHPSWFASENIVFRKEELAAAQIQTIFRDLVAFTVGALGIQITRDRLLVHATKHSAYELLRDLVVSVSRLRSDTLVRAMGLNHQFHFAMPEDAAHTVGHRLAPKEHWDGLLENPGLRSLQMQGGRNDSRPGYLLVRIEPSGELPVGIFVHVNDHFEIDPPDTSRAIDVLEAIWSESSERAQRIASQLIWPK